MTVSVREMSEINQNIEKNIYSITCTVKLVSLLFFFYNTLQLSFSE